MARFPGQVENFLRVKSIGIFMVGAIDSLIRRGHERQRLPLPQFKESILRLGEICAQLEVSPIFLGYHAVDEALTNPWRNGDRFTNASIQEYNDTVSKYAEDNNATYVEPYMNLYPYDEVLASDGIHPNPKGHQIICDSAIAPIDRILAMQ